VKPLPALLLNTGEEKTVPVHLEQRNLSEPVKLSVGKLPEGITVAEVPPLAPGADGAELRVTAAANAARGPGKVTVWAEAGGQRVKATLDLTVMFLPPRYKPAGPEQVSDLGGTSYYRRIRREFPGGQAVEFVLIPKTRNTDPDTFYMMVDKASVGLFRAFLEKTKANVNPDWEDSAAAGDEFPVFSVHVDDAQACAKWLGGQLPAPAQWDKAAGLYDSEGREGPFAGKWDEGRKPQVAVGRTAAAKVGEAGDDVSVFGCRDMAGNGREWTGSVEPGHRRVPLTDPPPGSLVQLRGRSFEANGPLLFGDMKAPRQPVFRPCPYKLAFPDLGFRVAIDAR
jgi:formylglycine-generating enzyme required for sulfatase activity